MNGRERKSTASDRARALATAQRKVNEHERLKNDLAALPRWRWLQRRQLEQRLDKAVEPPSCDFRKEWHAQFQTHVVIPEFRKIQRAKYGAAKHPFHPGHPDSDVDNAAEAILMRITEGRGLRVTDNAHYGFDLGNEEYVPKDFRPGRTEIEAMIRRELGRYADVAADDTFLVDQWSVVSGNRMIVQHKRSGLRARFSTDDRVYGSALAKSYEVPSIDTSDPDYSDYYGLGIGTRIYLEASRRWPNVRWSIGVVNENSAPMRRSLHARDPHRWAPVSCPSCNTDTWLQSTKLQLHDIH
jgi:hypothetical protein